MFRTLASPASRGTADRNRTKAGGVLGGRSSARRSGLDGRPTRVPSVHARGRHRAQAPGRTCDSSKGRARRARATSSCAPWRADDRDDAQCRDRRARSGKRPGNILRDRRSGATARSAEQFLVRARRDPVRRRRDVAGREMPSSEERPELFRRTACSSRWACTVTSARRSDDTNGRAIGVVAALDDRERPDLDGSRALLTLPPSASQPSCGACGSGAGRAAFARGRGRRGRRRAHRSLGRHQYVNPRSRASAGYASDEVVEPQHAAAQERPAARVVPPRHVDNLRAGRTWSGASSTAARTPVLSLRAQHIAAPDERGERHRMQWACSAT